MASLVEARGRKGDTAMTTEQPARERAEALVLRLRAESEELSPKEREFVLAAVEQGMAASDAAEVQGYGPFVVEGLRRDVGAAGVGEQPQTLTEPEFLSLTSKLLRMAAQLEPGDRALLRESFRRGISQEESDDVQGYAFLVTPMVGTPTPTPSPSPTPGCHGCNGCHTPKPGSCSGCY
jgi:hypothetical protein